MREIIYCFIAGFLLALGIIEGMAVEGAHIMRGHVERVALLQAGRVIR